MSITQTDNIDNISKIIISISKEEIFSNLLPFKYNGALIYATSIMVGDEIKDGIYGFGKNVVYFIEYENLPDIMSIEIPSSADELQEILTATEYIIQKICMNYQVHISDNTVLTVEEALYPFLRFIKNYEKNIDMIKGFVND